jgi:hypothetical protein
VSEAMDRVIKTMEVSADIIVSDMQSRYPTIRLRCTTCNQTRFGSWSYLKTGWPKCHGETMRLEAEATR